MLSKRHFDSKSWAEDNFAGCDLGDQRRSRRLETFARQAADRPAASLPKIGEGWGGAKAIYRLLNCEEATLASVTESHRESVKKRQGRFLIVADTTHVDLGWKRNVADAGPIGPGKGQGFLLHSGLMMDAFEEALIGLAGQVSFTRPKKRRGKQNNSQLMKRWRESEMWPELMEQIGPPPEQTDHIYVCDSAADNFEVFATAARLGADFVIRASRCNRNILVDGVKTPLSQAISGLQEVGRYQLQIERGNGREAREASLRVSTLSITVPLPSRRSGRIKKYVAAEGGDIPMWVVVVEEIDPPPGVEPIKWVLLTSLPVKSFDDAWQIIEWYERRWIVEEWHKALKTGCRLQDRQLQTVAATLPLAGVLSVVAVMLVQMKTAARDHPDEDVTRRVPQLWLKLLRARKKIPDGRVTNYEFWRGLAKLGGFLGRRHDGEPGWQTIWRGWQELHTMAEGAELLAGSG